jgi:hypothetical protein
MLKSIVTAFNGAARSQGSNVSLGGFGQVAGQVVNGQVIFMIQ